MKDLLDITKKIYKIGGLFLTLFFFSCAEIELPVPPIIESEYPKLLSLNSTEIKDFAVYIGSEKGAKEATGQFTPEELWGGRVSISPASFTLHNDSVIEFDKSGTHIYKTVNDSIFIRNYNNTWSKIGYYKAGDFIYHIALIYSYHYNEGSQTLLIENSYSYFNYNIFFATYPSIFPDDLDEESDKIAWCNIYSQYKINLLN